MMLLDARGHEGSQAFTSWSFSVAGLPHVLFFLPSNGEIYHPGSHWGSGMAVGTDLVCFYTFFSSSPITVGANTAAYAVDFPITGWAEILIAAGSRVYPILNAG